MRSWGSTPTASRIAWPRIVPQGAGAVNRPGSTSTSAWWTGCWSGHPAVRHALPLGPAAGAAGRGRLGQPRHGRRPSPSTPRWSPARLGDRVQAGSRMNEPWVRRLPRQLLRPSTRPGIERPADAIRVAHHLLLGHGLAVPRFRAAAPARRSASPSTCHRAAPASDSPEDQAAAARARTPSATGWFLDPLVRGTYPPDVLERPRPRRAPGAAMATWRRSRRRSTSWASTTTRRVVMRAAPATGLLGSARGLARPGEYTTMDWEVYPDGLRDAAGTAAPRLRPSRPTTSPRTAPPSPTSVDAGRRRSTTPAASPTWRPLRRGRRSAIADGVAAARLLRLVAARQLRVGLRLQPAVRHRLRGLSPPSSAC